MKPRPTPLNFTATVVPNPPMAAANVTLPLSVEFQGMLLKLLLTDREFGHALEKYVEPSHFQNHVHQWAWSNARAYKTQFWGFPTCSYLISMALQLPPETRDLFCSTMVQVKDALVTDEAAVRAMVLEFVKRNVFRQAYLDSRDLYNANKFDAAYDLMKERLNTLESVSFAPVRRGWLAEGFVDRHITRQDPNSVQNTGIPTGIPDVDAVLEGGLHVGELGIWIAYPKAGKSVLLVNLGLNAVRLSYRKVLHCVLEGNLEYIQNRYDTLLSDSLYTDVKKGEVDATKYAQAVQEVQYLRGLCVIRDFSENWETNALHIDAELTDLKRQHGFSPDLICVDYVDLMRARTNQDSETAHQKAATADLKTLAKRGHAVWTVSQVQRPKSDDFKDSQEVLTSAKVADAYAKIRIADFIGSINQTEQERSQLVMRLYAEMYRDGPANKTITINADFSKMRFGGGTPPVVASATGIPNPPNVRALPAHRTAPLGYGALKQTKPGARP